MSFLKSLTSHSNRFDTPFPHWELNNPLSEEAINEIIQAVKSSAGEGVSSTDEEALIRLI